MWRKRLTMWKCPDKVAYQIYGAFLPQVWKSIRKSFGKRRLIFFAYPRNWPPRHWKHAWKTIPALQRVALTLVTCQYLWNPFHWNGLFIPDSQLLQNPHYCHVSKTTLASFYCKLFASQRLPFFVLMMKSLRNDLLYKLLIFKLIVWWNSINLDT